MLYPGLRDQRVDEREDMSFQGPVFHPDVRVAGAAEHTAAFLETGSIFEKLQLSGFGSQTENAVYLAWYTSISHPGSAGSIVLQEGG